MKISKKLCGLLAATLASLAPVAASAADLGPAFIVNNYRLGSQYLANVAVGANGDQLVLWMDAARSNAFFMQRYDGTGAAIQSDEWFVTPQGDTTALDAFGNYAVTSYEKDGNGNAVYLTVYQRNGAVKVPRFKVNQVSGENAMMALVASTASGHMAISWTVVQSSGTLTPFVRTFSSAGQPTSPVMQVAPASTGQYVQGLAIDETGGVGIVWTGRSNTGAAHDYDVFYRRFGAAGSSQSPALKVNSYTPDSQGNCRLGMTPGGEAIVTWESTGQDGSYRGVYGQRLDRYGIKQGAEFRVNETTLGDQAGSRVGMAEDGSFVVSWISSNRTDDPTAAAKVMLRMYGPNGTALGGEQVAYTGTSTMVPDLTSLGVSPAGEAMLAWRVYNGSDVDVYARRYVLDNQPAVTTLSSNGPAVNLSANAGEWRYFKVTVPTGHTSLTVTLSGPGTGNADIYGRLGGLPSAATYTVVSRAPGNAEQIVINNVPAGTWYFGLYGVSTFSGVSFSATY
ncbi:PPC domain-containing protein [Roseateles flavus]|uniref:PPC domain-containing protein n=1 Tax=Roseateles flavus TaxID=3149041 RepID=A0ABV0GAF3_9BURK